jgi:hypothetical protein
MRQVGRHSRVEHSERCRRGNEKFHSASPLDHDRFKSLTEPRACRETTSGTLRQQERRRKKETVWSTFPAGVAGEPLVVKFGCSGLDMWQRGPYRSLPPFEASGAGQCQRCSLWAPCFADDECRRRCVEGRPSTCRCVDCQLRRAISRRDLQCLGQEEHKQIDWSGAMTAPPELKQQTWDSLPQ